MFKKLMFKKIEVWMICLLAMTSTILLLFNPNWISVGSRMLGISDIPLVINRLIDPYLSYRSSENRFLSKSGLYLTEKSRSRAGYFLLLSRFNSDENAFSAEIVDLQTGDTLHRWMPFKSESFVRSDHKSLGHPLLNPDGSLVFISNGSLIKVNACGNILWRVEGDFHHSIDIDSDGNFWVPKLFNEQQVSHDIPLEIHDGFAKISPEGKILHSESIFEMLIQTDRRSWIPQFARRMFRDPLHINYIKPVVFDGPYWKKGDLFLSLGFLNTVLLYRPEGRKVVWWTRDGLELQHDVNILNNHKISVFDNNKWIVPRSTNGRTNVDETFSSNDIVIYDFRTNEYQRPFQDALKKLEVRTPSQGLGRILPNGNLFFEESDFGRVGEVTTDGEIVWEHINRGSDGELYKVNWSRIYLPDESKELLRFLPIVCSKTEV